MSNTRSVPEPAVAAGDDPRQFAEVLSAVYDAAMAGERLPARPREVISDSWDRVASAGVDPDRGGPDDALGVDMARMMASIPLGRLAGFGMRDEDIAAIIAAARAD